ncbi:SAM-dependent methyltransferase [Winogradskya consettensis]|uniref:S-adenosyl methyltransferase n=2 Tax=Winogradskya consettensis TaxID=113560 RepID=A0A919SSZ2_9ACTN|nr:hypothetical protein Aco04nite_50080 [Actinoplanes consettensis]
MRFYAAGMDKPSMARMYDYYLGGNHHTPADVAAAERVLVAVPTLKEIARANRAFLRRAVTELTAAGVRQFLDIGSGIPTAGNVHEIAQQHAPDSHVVYVDIDPEAVAHSNELLNGNHGAAAVQADLGDPASILEHPEVERLLDFDRPIALLMLSVLQFLPDTTALPAVRKLRDALPPGSFLALTHPATDALTQGPRDTVDTVYRTTNAPTTTPRSRAEIAALFSGFELLEPGLVWVPLWRPDRDPGPIDPTIMPMLAGVAVRPGR